MLNSRKYILIIYLKINTLPQNICLPKHKYAAYIYPYYL
jgi:hypothetical protein